MREIDHKAIRQRERDVEREYWEYCCEKETLVYCTTMLQAHFYNAIYEIRKAIIDTFWRPFHA